MARGKAFDDLTAVTAARDVFWERGYGSTSLAQLQAATGLSKSSLYETYGSKRALFDRCARNYRDRVITPRLAPLEAPDAGPADLVRYFEGLATLFATAPERLVRRGCLLLNTATDLNDLDPAALDLVGGYRNRLHTAFLGIARRAPVPDPEHHADLLTAAQIGLMVTVRLDPVLASHLAGRLATEVRGWPRT